MPATLASHDDYLITLHEAPTPGVGPLVITFGGQGSGLSPSGFGTLWALKRGWDAIYVAQRANTQYQDLPLEAFAATVAPVCEGRDVVSYGSSLGGYAALYYGGSVDARIVAAAPMLPAWPPLNRKPHMIPVKHRPLHEVPRSRHAPVLIYDPTPSQDTMLIEEMVLRAYPEPRPITVEYAGHTILQMLAHAGVIGQILPPLIGEDRIAEFELQTENNPIWHVNKGKALSKLDPLTARHHLERSLDLKPSPHTLGNLLPLLLRLGDKAAAQAHLDRAAATGDRRLYPPRHTLDRAARAGLDVSAFH